MSPARLAVIAIAAALLALGLIVGMSSVEAGPNDFDPTACGSVLSPDDSDADMRDRSVGGGNVDACEKARGERKPVTYGALGLGVVAALFAFVVPSGSSPQRRA